MKFPVRELLIPFLRNGLHALALMSLLGSTLVLTACEDKPPSFANLDITGNTNFANDFSLPDTGRAVRSLSDYKGKVVIVTFGYTHCPDVCPTTLAELSQTLEALGSEAARRVQVLFVTVDPQRDTCNVLGQHVAAFNPSFRALRPVNSAQLQQAANAFKVVYEKVPGKTADNYTMDHSAACCVFDTNGRLRLYVRNKQGVTPWVYDLKILLDAPDRTA
ncbi:Cytochrome oxidase Cu insertion factor, SCO1/SenC/PrrC family [Burkholderia sp. CF099]|jgi:protein SCO1/2|nr:Cytochrome oxidase Cu insertion factor, SCO1/SenC/PrrC family [Burkholderia sp. CF099]